MLFELLTGQPPFKGESPVAIAYQHVGEQPPPPSRFAEGVSGDLDAVVLHALAKPREERYQDASEFRADLMAVRLGRPISPAARGTAAALAGAAVAGAAVAGATEALPVAEESPTQAYLSPAAPLPPTGETFPPLGDEDDEERRRPAMIVLLTIAVLAALGLLGWGLFAAFGGDDTPQVTVPDVVGTPVQTAEVELTRAGLQVEVTTESSDSVPKDEVISQDPSAGTEVDEESTVTLAVSAGPEAVEVPDVRGLSLDEARGILEDVGLSVGKITKSDEPDVEQDEVISSDPASGTQAEAGSKVNLEVGTGRVKVPNVVGMTQSAAQNALSQAGLEYETSFEQTDSSKEGTVVEQDPNDGEPVDQGSTVKIVIAQAPAPTVTATTVTPTPTTSSPTSSPSGSSTPTDTATTPAP
jgi:serine/threonine-protein kinase